VKRGFVYRSWSPEGDTWRDWVKPVLFAALDEEVTAGELSEPPGWLGPRLLEPLAASPSISEEHPYREAGRVRDTAIVVDLPGRASAELGVALAHHGFRPVPLYNAVPAPLGVAGLVDVRPIMEVLVDAAALVRTLPEGLPPAFLLDADRLAADRMPEVGEFDNRSMCRPSDFPSPETLLQCGLRRVVLIRSQPSVDLDAIVLDWQRHGIAPWSVDGGGESDACPVVLRERSWFTRLFDFLRGRALPKRSDGAYGMMTIPHGG
jgi:hypothetical protein